MPRSFRFEPPAPRPGSLTRPRLLRALLGRWDHRVTTVVGGPGLGKATLLAQALAEKQLAPRGEDVWLGLDCAASEFHKDGKYHLTGEGKKLAPEPFADFLAQLVKDGLRGKAVATAPAS